MTNEAVLDILNHLCNEARNSVHATFAVMDMLPAALADRTWHTYFDIGRSSADRLLRSIDDFRALLSVTRQWNQPWKSLTSPSSWEKPSNS